MEARRRAKDSNDAADYGGLYGGVPDSPAPAPAPVPALAAAADADATAAPTAASSSAAASAGGSGVQQPASGFVTVQDHKLEKKKVHYRIQTSFVDGGGKPVAQLEAWRRASRAIFPCRTSIPWHLFLHSSSIPKSLRRMARLLGL
eukprot:SAG11_NODE_3874_length_2177_cov_1.636670_4_plen_146_part_00